MAQASEFIRNKLSFVFDTFFDVNKDGSIQRNDFELAIQKICRIRGYKEGDEKYAKTSEGLMNVWEGLRKEADSDGDDEVDRNEWVALWTKGQGNQDWKALYRDNMFQLFDSDGDGAIDAKEFKMITGAFGVPEKEAELAFSKISQNGSVKVDRAEYEKLWEEFFSSEDTKASGNAIFGKIF